MWDKIIIILIGLAALFFIIRGLIRVFGAKGGGCAGCAGCPMANVCNPKSDPDESQTPKSDSST